MRRGSLVGVMLPRDLFAPLLAGLATRENRLAFWINVYNDLVTERLAALGIRPTVWEVPDFFERIRTGFAELDFPANDIEHGGPPRQPAQSALRHTTVLA